MGEERVSQAEAEDGEGLGWDRCGPAEEGKGEGWSILAELGMNGKGKGRSSFNEVRGASPTQRREGVRSYLGEQVLLREDKGISPTVNGEKGWSS
ncbi:hypothetical protein Pmani_010482 [Petrolisthes manimaculis]|uniref:Uncharacterized protein n=1 Tax=Petrolisthes manimaculis TaxID=1843537 RepID=A0AAE1UH90_9EUCA|nr:hypothetical protein Pmani_010482 [Petrolisthes manimaculis]